MKRLLNGVEIVILFLASLVSVIFLIFFVAFKSFLAAFEKNSDKKFRNKKFSLHKIRLRYFLIGIIFAIFFVCIPVWVFLVVQTFPNPSVLGLQEFPQTTKIYDRNHILLYTIYANQNRTLINLNQVPISLQEATIAIEDKSFYSNLGFDPLAIVRAGISDLTGGQFQGGSTITQQLIKSALLTSDITIGRKIEEIILSFWTDRIYSKKQILTMYFNEVPYGGTAWGVEAASQTYFGKDVKDLDLAQSAFLAGLPQAPTLYSPYGQNPNLWKQRQHDVLNRMQELGYINSTQKQIAENENLVFQPEKTSIIAPHFVMYVRNLLIERYGLAAVEKGGLTVTTTLDSSLQEKTQNIVSNEVKNDNYLNLTNGAAIVTNPQNGDILAMVGSADPNNPVWGQVNVATSLRQPGSSIKVVTYSAALSNGFTAATILDDSPVSFPSASGTYTPVNYDGKFHGKVTLRQAFANSFNIPAVKTLNAIGIPTFVNLGKEMGISNLGDASDYGLSVTLGSPAVTMLDMATAYGTVANGGYRVELNPILEVQDYRGNILEQKQVSKTQVLDPGVTFIVSDILADNNARSWEFGTNSPLNIPGHRVSVKTGTSDDKRDNWTIGFNPNRVVTVWVGNNDNTPMSQVLASGITGAAPIWHNIMEDLVTATKDDTIQIPSDIVSKSCNGHSEYFLKGTENKVNCLYSLPTWTPTPESKQ